jgi:aminoglycoside phosphotransferase (APT) family kinase protein
MTASRPGGIEVDPTLLDLAALSRWALSQDLPGSGEFTVTAQLSGGTQNNIFLLDRGGASMVLRRPPRHLRANSNTTMVREARVLAALNTTDVPHPGLLARCADTAVIGAAFYLMEPISGFSPSGALPAPYDTRPAWRRAIPVELTDAASRLGLVDHRAVGLADFGKPDNWLDRQVDRWAGQLEGYTTLPGYEPGLLPHVAEVGGWLRRHQPSRHHIGIIHGDLLFSNVMFSHDEPRLAAIIDWELSSLGDPQLDLARLFTALVEPGDPPGRDQPFQPAGGLPARRELADRYASATERDLTDFGWFFVLCCYKVGIILEGTYARALAGLADQATGERLHRKAVWHLEMARHATATPII